MDRCLQLEPIGEECTPGNLCPHITTIGGVAPIQIDPNTGYANGPAVFDGWTAIDSPFGGLVTITGDVLNVPDFVYDCDCNNIDYSTDMRYKFEYRRWSYEDSNWSEWDDMTAQHNDRFLIYVDKVCDFGPTMICDQLVKWNIRDSEGFYSYYEDIYGDIRQSVAGKVLMKWSTTGLVDGLYEIRMVIKFGAAIMEFSRRKMILDNTAPQVDLDFDLGTCFQEFVGTIITGRYTAFDQHLLRSGLLWDCGAGCLSGDPNGPKKSQDTDRSIRISVWLILQFSSGILIIRQHHSSSSFCLLFIRLI